MHLDLFWLFLGLLITLVIAALYSLATANKGTAAAPTSLMKSQLYDAYARGSITKEQLVAGIELISR